jgi:hypothetical protein
MAAKALAQTTGVVRDASSARAVLSLAISLAVTANAFFVPACVAAAKSKSIPSGTLLIPITPKIDSSIPGDTKPSIAPRPVVKQPVVQPIINAQPVAKAAPLAPASPENKSTSRYASQLGDDESLKPAPDNISAEQGNEDELAGSEVGEDTTLKGTIQLVADDTEYDQEKNTFLGSGNAVVILAGQNSKLEADTILYDQNNQVIDARGNVRIFRDGQVTTGSAFKFKVTSDEYLITNPDTEVNGTAVIARKGFGDKKGLQFRDGTLEMPNPIHFVNNGGWAPLSSMESVREKNLHPDAFMPEKQSYKFKARKMVYERYKDSGNVTVFGGRLMKGSFGVPIPKFTMTANQDNNRVVFPITPLITNNFQMGGTSIGPQFNFAEGKHGVFSVAPLVQIGGRTESGSTGSNIGAGFRLGYTDRRLSTHLAYGSVSNLVVADFKYQITKNLKFQAGVNRFTEDGLFGMRRPRLIAEAVHYKFLTELPYLSNMTFRSSAGWAQDNPQLLNLTPQYAKLFTVPPKAGNVSAFRVQEQISATTHPIFAVGDNKVGAKMFFFGGVAAKGYSTGNALLMGQLGPILDLRLNRLQLRGGYTQSGVAGKSPFVFDEFIQGNRSVNLQGDFKINKYITLGASTGYNLVSKLAYQKTLTAAIGPDDFKLLLSRDFVRGINRYGFDLLFGQPIPFNKLVLKGNPDQGQFGGI